MLARGLGHAPRDTIQRDLPARLERTPPAREKTTPVTGRRGRYRPDDDVLAFLTRLSSGGVT
jgi:hypothetical protein